MFLKGRSYPSKFEAHETSSPPRSMPKPVSTLPMRDRSSPMFGLPPVGGKRVSKLRRLLASRAANGVLDVTGVRAQVPAI